MEQIIIGMDGSSGAAGALRWALREGDLHGGPVTATLVWDYLNQHHSDGSTTFHPGYDSAAAQEALASFVAGAVGERDANRVGLNLVFDLVAHGLVGASTAASLLVVGARGLGGFKELLLGSVSQRCLHGAACPVAIVRTVAADQSHEYRRVVVGVDGSSDSQAALRWAAVEAVRRSAVLRVVHAAQPALVDVPLPDPVRAIDVIHKEANAVLEQALVRAALPDTLTVEVKPATGSPAKALLDACVDADLIVLGRAGRGLLGGGGLGAVATQVSHHSRVPAVFVKADDRR